MYRVTVEILPHGDEQRKRTVATMEIANDLTGDEITGNYKYRLWEAERGAYAPMTRDGRIVNHIRNSSVFTLIRMVLMDAHGILA